MKEDNPYFAICPACAGIEWYELEEEITFDDVPSKVNYLKSDGTIGYPNKYVRLKKKEYIDIVCRRCECPMVILPFDVVTLTERKRVFQMSSDDRKKYAERFELLDSLDDEETKEIL